MSDHIFKIPLYESVTQNAGRQSYKGEHAAHLEVYLSQSPVYGLIDLCTSRALGWPQSDTFTSDFPGFSLCSRSFKRF